jgi:predicted Fe-Mo cluster-binding NifX family protein
MLDIKNVQINGESMTKHIAIPTDDGQTISSHLGQARYFQVISLEDGKVLSSEARQKVSHTHQQHSHDESSQAHPGKAMFEAIQDCQVLIAGGMGSPAFERARSMGMEVYLTGEKQIEAAMQAYQAGKLDSDMRRVHNH